MIAVCSNNPRPSVQKSGKGHQHWKREVFHFAVDKGGRTLCGKDASEWLVIGDATKEHAENSHCCARCSAKFRT